MAPVEHSPVGGPPAGGALRKEEEIEASLLAGLAAKKALGTQISFVRRRSEDQHTPLLIHFDVNKTVIPSDSLKLTGIEDGIRESAAELFFGTSVTGEAGAQPHWVWTRTRPSCARPSKELCGVDGSLLMTYADFCKRVVQDKEERKNAIRRFVHAGGADVKEEMERLVKSAMERLWLPTDVQESKDLENAGLNAKMMNMFPAIFHLAAALQRTGRPFAILFRSFGSDHKKVQQEWNAFCELKHPIFSRLIQDIGPMDGSVPGIPDRRFHRIHTLYRDTQGPLLLKDTFTNGPKEASWDSWAKEKPKRDSDTRNGREFVSKELPAATAVVEDYSGVRAFMAEHLCSQGTAGIKDDWAWWTWNGEQSKAGKLMTLFEGLCPAQQVFFDDNVGQDDPRIVDCRDIDGAITPYAVSLGKFCQKVNPVEAVLDDHYFIKKLLAASYSNGCYPQVATGPDHQCKVRETVPNESHPQAAFRSTAGAVDAGSGAGTSPCVVA